MFSGFITQLFYQFTLRAFLKMPHYIISMEMFLDIQVSQEGKKGKNNPNIKED